MDASVREQPDEVVPLEALDGDEERTAPVRPAPPSAPGEEQRRIPRTENGEHDERLTGIATSTAPAWAARSTSLPRGVSAADVTEERMLRATSEPPSRGWRRAVHRLTGGLVTPKPSDAELEARRRIATLKTKVEGSRIIAAVSTKGGVGKTTTTVSLGHTFAAHRGDRVVALDGNPDAGSLGYRIRLETAATAEELLAEADRITRYADLRAFTSQASSRLEIVAAPDDPRVSTALGQRDYRRLLDLLEHHYQLILVDCGTGILDAATRGIVEAADQLVVVTGPSIDAARATSYLLDWLEKHDRTDLVAGAVAVINGVRQGKGLVDLEEVDAHFAERCRSVVQVPWDHHLAAGARTGLDLIGRDTRDAYVELAAAVAEGFGAIRQDKEGIRC